MLFLQVITESNKELYHLNFSLERPLHGSKRFENTGFAGLPVIQQQSREALKKHWQPPCPALSRCIQTIAARAFGRCMGNRKLSETMIAMSFVERWMKISDAGLDNKFAEPNHLTYFCYSSQE
jgi:hypothetical protein